jgi:hypothetical protein
MWKPPDTADVSKPVIVPKLVPIVPSIVDAATLSIPPEFVNTENVAALPILGKHCAKEGINGSKNKGKIIPFNHLKVIFFMCLLFKKLKKIENE